MIFSIVNALKSAIYPNSIDISPFIKKVSTIFLPQNVYELEEYGLPRMISKLIVRKGILPLDDDSIPLSTVIEQFQSMGCENLINSIPELTDMDKYIIRYFYEGI